MNYFDNEKRIIELFQDTDSSEVYLPGEPQQVIEVFNSIHDKEKWKSWIDSSGKNAPPPDFYSDRYKLMMDVMRVDDHAFKNKKGKVVNPTNAGESQLHKELENSGLLSQITNVEHIIINAKTNLSTDADHNYNFYVKNFERVLSEHNKKINLYRKNHNKHEVIFFILDESSAYISTDKTECEHPNIKGKPHLFFMDKVFTDVLSMIDADYCIWYTPFKLLQTDSGIVDLPKVCAFRKESIKQLEVLSYDNQCMISSEV